MSNKMDYSELITAEDILLASQEDPGFMDDFKHAGSDAFRAPREGVYFLLNNACLLKINGKHSKC